MENSSNQLREPFLNLELSNVEQENKPNSGRNTFQNFSLNSDTSGDSKKLSFNFSTPYNDFNINFYRDSESLRKSYFDVLKMKFKFIDYKLKRDYNSLILFDWDDTLFCASYLTKKKILLNNKNIDDLGEKFKDKINNVQQKVINILKLSIEHGDTYIITNATKCWVEFSCSLIYPRVVDYLSKINIISARDNYEHIFPNEPKKWKLQTFLDLTRRYDNNRVANIICIGDSEEEAEAAMEMGTLFREAYLKIIKFREDPKPEHIAKQLSLVEGQFKVLHSSVRNISIHVEKNKKNN